MSQHVKQDQAQTDYDVVIVGGGFGGIAAARELADASVVWPTATRCSPHDWPGSCSMQKASFCETRMMTIR